MSKIKRLGIYGGTFNPPHLGHLRAAEAALSALNLDLLLFIPAGIPPHKRVPQGTPPGEVRARMVEKMIEGRGKMALDPREIRREGFCFTADTVTELKRDYPDAERFLLVGTDMLLTLQSWRMPEVIFRTTTVAALPRLGEDLMRVRAQAAFLRKTYGAKIEVIASQPLEVSSTQVRELLGEGKGAEYLAPVVMAYIREQGLYGCPRWDLEALRREVAGRVDARRFSHILGTEEEAARLARRWGAPEFDARAAAILHDITKCLGRNEQLQCCEKYGIMLDIVERENKKLLHALTGAKVAEQEFHASHEVCSAIRYHTTGRADMSLLEKVIYLADYIEPGRRFEGVDRLRALAYENLDRAVYEGLEMSVSFVQSEGGMVHPASLEARDWLRAQLTKE